MNKELMNMKELSNYLGMSIPYIRKLVRELKIPHYRIGTTDIRFDKNEINAWIDKQKIDTKD